MISAMTEHGYPARRIIKLLGVSESGYYAWRDRALSARSLRHAWITRIILDLHASSGATFGYRRIHQELAHRYGIKISHGTVERLMGQAGLRGRPGRRHHTMQTTTHQLQLPGPRWVVDVCPHATPAGTWWAALVLDTTSRRPVALRAGSHPTTLLIDRALDQAITRHATTGTDPLAGCFFTVRAYTHRHPSAPGTIADWFDHALVEAFWNAVREELPDHHYTQDPEELEDELHTTLEHFTQHPPTHAHPDQYSDATEARPHPEPHAHPYGDTLEARPHPLPRPLATPPEATTQTWTTPHPCPSPRNSDHT